MKRTAILILGILTLVSCRSLNSKNSEQPTSQEPLIVLNGGDKDENGCIGSAGYTYSLVREDCIRLFEVGHRLDPIDSKDSSSGYLVFNTDHSKLELFLPSTGKGIILLKTSEENFRYNQYQFAAGTGVLSIDGKASYKKASE